MDMSSNNNRSYHRPFNSVKSSSSERIGRTLLDLIRTRDKVSSSSQSTANQQLDYDEQEQEITQLDIQITLILNKLSNTISSSNGGLFNSDINRAQSFYECANNRSSSAITANNQNENGRDTSGGGGGKKRKRSKGGGSSNNTSNSISGLSAISYGIHLDSHSNNQQSISGDSKGDSLDEGLILTSICKILGVTIGRKKKQQQQTDESQSVDEKSNITTTGIQQQQSHRYSYNLICGALNVLLSICNHAKDYESSSFSANAFTTDNGVTMTCASIELDMISSIGSYLVDALFDNILYLYYSSISGNGDSSGNGLEGLVGCFKVCASLVSLLNIKLSKCTKSIANLYDTTWLVLNNLTALSISTTTQEDTSTLQKAGTVLLSTLVLVGNSDGMPQSKIWNTSIANGITLLKWAVNDFFPIVDNKDQGNRKQSSLWKEHEKWLSIAKEDTENKPENESSLDLSKDDPTDTHRSQALQHRIQVISNYIHSLLTMDGYPLQQNCMIGINLPLDALLDISEILLSFPLAAEAKHRSTKSRLRSIPIKNGLLSPYSAMEISPSIKLCGHLLFDVTVESTRGAGILSKARRIVGMSVSSLQSSCSLALVSAVDGNRRGSTSTDRVSKIGIHLRESISLRIKSIYTFHCVSVSLGSGVMSSTGTCKSMCRALVLLGGCLLEQVTGLDDELSGDGDWGTLGERAKLVKVAANALGACIATFGGLIPTNVRGTLDSIINTCLSTLYSRGGSQPIFAYSNVKRTMLQLGMNCVCVPWGDGGRSSITNVLRTVCTMLRSDSDTSVASTALSTLCACDAFTTPRAPPLLIPTRDSMNASHMTASSMLQGMKDSKQEMLASEEAKEERKKKLDKKSSKKKKAKKEEAATNDDSTLTVEKIYDADSKVAKVETTKSEEPITNNVPIQSANTSDKTEESSVPPTDKMAVSEDVEPPHAKEIDTEPMNEDQEEPQSDKGPVVETTKSSEPNDIQMNDEDDGGDDEDDGDSDGSFDFPEIVDGDPDEEDR